jgi:hypothetical protein
MRVTERNNHAPSGLTRFLTLHEECPRGLEILRDQGLVTIVCHGCESSFSYLTKVPPGKPTEVEQALQGLASDRSEPQETSNGSRPAEKPAPKRSKPPEAVAAGSGGEERVVDSVWSPPKRLRPPAPPPSGSSPRRPSMLSAARRAENAKDDDPQAPEPKPRPPSVGPPSPGAKPVRLPPPGPLAPRRRKKRHRDSWLSTLRPRAVGVARAVSQRRRPIAMAALSLAGAYVVIALSTGGEQSSSDTPALGGADLPLQAPPSEDAETGAVADGARTVESFGDGGPDAAPVSGADGSFELTLPPGWEQGTTDGGSDRFEAPGGHAEVLVRAEQKRKGGVGELADRGAAFLAVRLPAGAKVERIPSRSEGELLVVARASGGNEVKTAYVADADGVQYLVVSSYDEDASSMDRLQAEGIVRSFDPRPASK